MKEKIITFIGTIVIPFIGTIVIPLPGAILVIHQLKTEGNSLWAIKIPSFIILFLCITIALQFVIIFKLKSKLSAIAKNFYISSIPIAAFTNYFVSREKIEKQPVIFKDCTVNCTVTILKTENIERAYDVRFDYTWSGRCVSTKEKVFEFIAIGEAPAKYQDLQFKAFLEKEIAEANPNEKKKVKIEITNITVQDDATYKKITVKPEDFIGDEFKIQFVYIWPKLCKREGDYFVFDPGYLKQTEVKNFNLYIEMENDMYSYYQRIKRKMKADKITEIDAKDQILQIKDEKKYISDAFKPTTDKSIVYFYVLKNEQINSEST